MASPDDVFRQLLTRAAGGEDEDRAPTRLKSTIYSRLIADQQETGPLRTLPETQAAGRGLCVFEQLVKIAPLPEKAKQPFFCWTCHARIAGELIEHAPIFWPNCPYSDFQKG